MNAHYRLPDGNLQIALSGGRSSAEWIAGEECSGPLFAAQRKAWEALREARKQAGIARGALTRMALKAGDGNG